MGSAVLKGIPSVRYRLLEMTYVEEALQTRKMIPQDMKEKFVVAANRAHRRDCDKID